MCTLVEKDSDPCLEEIIKIINWGRSYSETDNSKKLQVNTVRQILLSLKPKEKLNILLAYDTDDYSRSTPLHIACSCEHDQLDTIKCIIESIDNFQQLVSVLTAQDRRGDTPLHRAARDDSGDGLLFLVRQLVCRFPTQKPTDKVPTQTREQPDKFPSKTRQPSRKRSGLLSRLAGILSQKTKSAGLGVEEVLMMPNRFGVTFFHSAVMYNSDSVINDLISVLSPFVSRKLAEIRENDGKTVLHRAACNYKHPEVVKYLIRFIEQQHNRPEMEKMIFMCNEHEETFLHIAAQSTTSFVMSDVLTMLPFDWTTRLLGMTDYGNMTPLIRAVKNKEDSEVILTLLRFITEKYEKPDVQKLLLHEDFMERNFLHYLAINGSAGVLLRVFSEIPRQMVLKLSLVKDLDGKTARDLTESSLMRDYLDQAGCYPLDVYPLKKPPEVIIFYRTTNRQTPLTADGEQTDADTEKDCLEKYFTERSIQCTVKRNPTSEEIFSIISEAQTDTDLSGLMVFVMSHGEKGVVTVEGDPGFVMIQDIITHMCCYTRGKPKVLVIQACQMRDTPPQHLLSNVRLDPIPGKLTALNRQPALLKYHPDFLLYQATVSGSYAFRHLMIPCLIESLRQLEPSDSMTQACELTNYKVRLELERLDPKCAVGQLPKLESTLSKKFCIGKEFRCTEVPDYQLDGVQANQ